MAEVLAVLSPVAGTVVAMRDVPDPVFAAEIVGPGIAIEPTPAPGEAVAAVSGRIVKMHPHAYVIQTDDGRGVLVHLGIDTVQLGGVGFTLHAGDGDTVTAGKVLISWDPAEVVAGGRSAVCPVVALEGKPEDVDLVVETGASVAAGQALLHWR